MSLADIWDFIINVNLFYVFGGIIVFIIFGWLMDQPSGFESNDEDNEDGKKKEKSKFWLIAFIWLVLMVLFFGILFFFE